MNEPAPTRKPPRFLWILVTLFGAFLLVALVVLAATTATLQLEGGTAALPSQQSVLLRAGAGARRIAGTEGKDVAGVLCAVATSDPEFLRGSFEWQAEQWEPADKTLRLTGVSAVLEYVSGRTETITVEELTLHYEDPGQAPVLATGRGLGRSPSAIPLLKRWASVKITP